MGDHADICMTHFSKGISTSPAITNLLVTALPRLTFLGGGCSDTKEK